MTQFALVKINGQGVVDNSLVKLSDVDDSFLENVAKELFPKSQLNDLYCFQVGGFNFDEIFLGAQKQINVGMTFEQTDLAKLLKSIFDKADEIVCWYGSDYDDLDNVGGIDSLLEKLEMSVREPSCEAYVYFKRNF